MAYIGNGPGVASQRILTTLTATEGQTSFTPSAGYTLGYVDVFLNGVKLIDGTDYAAADGVSIVLTEAATLDDTVEVVAYFPRGLSDGYTKAEADGRYEPLDSAYTKAEADSRYEPLDSAYTKAEADGRYVEVSGDAMTGNLTVPMVVTSSALSNRNLIINGAMQVAQRGTSFTDVANSSYSLDRWVTEYAEASFELDFEQVSGSAPKGFQYSLKATSQDTHTADAAQYIIPFEQRIEKNIIDQIGWGSSEAQEFTLSFWIKSNRTGTNTVNLNLSVPTGGTDDATTRQYTIDAANTWEYKTITFPANTSTYSGEANLGNRGLTLFWWMVAGSNYTSGSIPTGWENETQANRAVGCSNRTTLGDYWQITGVQLEVGDTATPFEHRSYGDELARCQRYYQVGAYNGNAGTDLGDTNPTVSWMPVTAMRASATMSMRDDNAVPNRYIDTQGNSVSWFYGGLSHRADNTSFTGSYTNSIDTGMFVLDIGSASVGASSWIRFFWQADAEL